MTKILVIEDESMIREKLLTILRHEGYYVIDAENGDTGIRKAREHLPGLILCDVIMPGLSGYGVLETLREDPVTADIPFIFLTALAAKRDQRYGMSLGADDYLTKPFTIDELLSAIRSRLTRQAATSQKMETLRLSLSQLLPHELRTPLTGILSVADLLVGIDPKSDPHFKEILPLLQLIHKHALRLNAIIENYLLYANLRLLEHEPERRSALRDARTIQSAGTIASFVKYYAEQMEREEDVSVDFTEANLAIEEKYVYKIVRELLDNAFKFSDPETPVHVTTKKQGEYLLLRITDQGRGMTKAQIAKIGAYMQFDRQLYEQQGLGFGLILSRLLAELHGGQLTVKSGLGVGTVVEVMLPEANA